ncbi:unnamed protein product [Miscanthus lutarioriparius]|uniref:DUF4283 domain-containing protein n=1 Tax=Miscanthus lutarioriparius TaxID=422564 RepID=A0A811R8J3_9POAL|nr:unnamed protein product [Miscanthus lutarioriparius]
MPFVDFEPSRCYAYAYVEPARADPGPFIRLALERRGSDPPFSLAASSRGAMVVAFCHPYFWEVTVRRSPIRMDGSILMLEPHEEADFRFTCRYRLLGEVVAYDFPLEHWTLEHITIAFWAIGNVCCVDPDYLRGNDFSTVRVLLLVDNLEEIPERLILRNFGTRLAAVARLRVVDFWVHPEGASLPAAYVISGLGDDGTDDTEDTHSAPGSRAPRLPRILILDLPTPMGLATPPPAPSPSLPIGTNELGSCHRSTILSLEDLMAEEEHEVNLRRCHAQRKHAADSASKIRRSRRLAVKENPFYEDATSKATRVQAAKLDLSKASSNMAEALACSSILKRPPPACTAPSRLHRLARVCGIQLPSDAPAGAPTVV